MLLRACVNTIYRRVSIRRTNNRDRQHYANRPIGLLHEFCSIFRVVFCYRAVRILKAADYSRIRINIISRNTNAYPLAIILLLRIIQSKCRYMYFFQKRWNGFANILVYGCRVTKVNFTRIWIVYVIWNYLLLFTSKRFISLNTLCETEKWI